MPLDTTQDIIDFKHVHFVGIGGIGVSAIAKYLKLHSVSVSGSDKQDFEVVADVQALNIPVTIGFSPANIPHETDLVVYSDAFREANVEVDTAHARGIKTVSYAEMLGMVTKNAKLFAVTGTNGKSTTTAMLGKILEHAVMDPTVLVGSKVPGFLYGNLRVGDPETWVVEADDYREHFLALTPAHAIVNNVELDHLDYFKDYPSVERAFTKFVEQVKTSGVVILNADNPGALLLKKVHPEAKTFSLKGLGDYSAHNIHVAQSADGPRMVFDVTRGEEMLGEVKLRVPGEMNVSNAMAALSLSLEVGVSFEKVKESLEAFTGIWRRFEKIGNNPVIISDYAHHPTAVLPTIAAAREFYPGKKIIAVFQPHQEDRLRALFDNFVVAFDMADVIVLAPVFKATGRESGEAATSEMLAEAIRLRDAQYKRDRNIIAFSFNDEVLDWLEKNANKNDCILVMTAGDLYARIEHLSTILTRRFV